MKKIFGSSWRTSAMGYTSAIAAVVIPIIQDDGFDIHKQWKSLVIAVLVALWGRVQKDTDGIKSSDDKIVARAATDGAIPPAGN